VCFGDGSMGQLGRGDMSISPTPTAVVGGRPWAQVSAGVSSTCAIDLSGGLYCWGSGTNGRLGNGGVDPATSPAAVGLGYVQVSVGDAHACAVKSDGALVCWGAGGSGRLGNGTPDDRAVPTPVAGGRAWLEVAAGAQHTCAIDASGAGLCWGYNLDGELGLGTVTMEMPAPTPFAAEQRWTHIAAGGAHTCGVHADTTVWCWGSNLFGQVGPGAAVVTLPTRVMGLANVTQIDTGQVHTCAVQGDGTLWCWGDNTTLQLGRSDVGGGTGTPSQVEPTMLWADVGTGFGHSCAFRDNAELWCWGSSAMGQLGTSDCCSAPPRRVDGFP